MHSILPLFFFFASRRRHTRYWRDWSSERVLFRSQHERHPRHVEPREQRGGRHDERVLEERERRGDRRERRQREVHEVEAEHEPEARLPGELVLLEIGTASCRDRVQLSVVAVSLKK